MQMLYEASDESPGVPGLGVLPGTIAAAARRREAPADAVEHARRAARRRPLLDGLPRPGRGCTSCTPTRAEDADDAVATCDYGGAVVAAVERGNVWATQFHPEKSAANGLRILLATSSTRCAAGRA